MLQVEMMKDILYFNPIIVLFLTIKLLIKEHTNILFQSYYSLISNISVSINPTHNPISILL